MMISDPMSVQAGKETKQAHIKTIIFLITKSIWWIKNGRNMFVYYIMFGNRIANSGVGHKINVIIISVP